MRHVLQTQASIRGFGCAIALTMSMLALSGCTTTGKKTADASLGVDQAVPEDVPVDPRDNAPGTYRDPRVAAVGGTPQQQAAYPAQAGYPAQANAMVPVADNSQLGSLTMQNTGVKATSSSIFAIQNPNSIPVQMSATAEPQGSAPLPVGQETGVNAMSNSLFNASQPPAQATPLPMEGAANTQGLPTATQDVASGDSVRTGTATQPAAAELARLNDGAKASVAQAAVRDVAVPQTGETEPDQAEKSLTLVGLFAAKRKGRKDGGTDPFAKALKTKDAGATMARQPQIAALGFTALPGIRTTSMFATVDDSQPGHDDQSPAVELASLPGLARLAPNGLWLQTATVETGCFQPELMRLLNVVETHYGRKVVVTSGLRDLKHNARAGGRPHSLHTTCQAADIQVPGISKWDLADYLKTLPGRGGVGTYCHTESVHIDTGEVRDWNWRCRQRSV